MAPHSGGIQCFSHISVELSTLRAGFVLISDSCLMVRIADQKSQKRSPRTRLLIIKQACGLALSLSVLRMTSRPPLQALQSALYTPFSHRICKRFLPTHARTAKCDDCGQPNRTSMVRCIDCARHTCQSCMAAQGWVLEEKGSLKNLPDLLPLVHRNVPLTTRPLFLIDADKTVVDGHDHPRPELPAAAVASVPSPKKYEEVQKSGKDVVAKGRTEDKSIRRRPVPRREPVGQQRNMTRTEKRSQDSGFKPSRDTVVKEAKGKEHIVRGTGNDPFQMRSLGVREKTDKSQPASPGENTVLGVERRAYRGPNPAREFPNTLIDAAHTLLSLSTPTQPILAELADTSKRVQRMVDNQPFAWQSGRSQEDTLRSAMHGFGSRAPLTETKREVVACSHHPLMARLPPRPEKLSIQFLLCPMD